MDGRLREIERRAATGDSDAQEQLRHLQRQAGMLVARPRPIPPRQYSVRARSYQLHVDSAVLTTLSGERIALNRSQIERLLAA